MALPLLGGLGAFLASPAGQQLLGGLAMGAGQYALPKLREKLFGPTPPTAEQQAQQSLLQQLQTPMAQFQPVAFDPIAQQIQQQFQRQELPALAERFVGAGGARTGAFARAMTGAQGDLAARLAALRAQHDVGQQQAALQQRGLNLQQQGMLGRYLTGQQQLGLGAQQLGQRQREAAFNALSGLGSFGLGQTTSQQQRAQAQANAAGQAVNLGLGQQAQPTYQPATPGILPGVLGGLGAATGGYFGGIPGVQVGFGLGQGLGNVFSY